MHQRITIGAVRKIADNAVQIRHKKGTSKDSVHEAIIEHFGYIATDKSAVWVSRLRRITAKLLARRNRKKVSTETLVASVQRENDTRDRIASRRRTAYATGSL